jgi:hypothetical protein
MAFLIKLKSSNTFWTAKEDAVWTDQLEMANRYEDLEEAELDLEEKANQYGYQLEIADEEDIEITEVEVKAEQVEEETEEESEE